MKYIKLYEIFNEKTFLQNINNKYEGESLKIKLKYYTAKTKFTEVWQMFKIGEITYHYDKFNNFHTYNIYREDCETNDHIDIVIDPKNPDYPKKLFLRFEDKWSFDIIEWKKILDDFIFEINNTI